LLWEIKAPVVAAASETTLGQSSNFATLALEGEGKRPNALPTDTSAIRKRQQRVCGSNASLPYNQSERYWQRRKASALHSLHHGGTDGVVFSCAALHFQCVTNRRPVGGAGLEETGPWSRTFNAISVLNDEIGMRRVPSVSAVRLSCELRAPPPVSQRSRE
jgi:hypothetical protein